jgi:flagellar hook assembly protein FlgD
MPVSDLIVHPREHDLVIGTFGRSFWIVDDIRPLRALAKESGGIEATFQSFDSPGAILAKIGESIGYRDGKVGDVLYGGENREYGALISYYVKDANEKDSVLIEISNASGEVVRNLIHTPKSGMNRFAWDLSRNGVRSPNRTKPEKRSYPRGKSVLPGDYNVQMTFKNQVAKTAVQVSADPRIQVSEVEMKKKDQLIRDHDDQVQKVTEVADQIRSVKESLQFVEKKLNKQNVKGLKTLVEAALDELSKIEEEFNPKPRPGIYRDPAILNSVLRQTDYMLDDVLSPAGENVLNQMRLEKEKCALFIQAYDTFVSTHLIPLKAKVKEADISIF